MKHVCLLTDSLFTFGGVQRVTAVLAKQLASDCQVTIVTRDDAALLDTSMYQLAEARLHYRFFCYPLVPEVKQHLCKVWSAVYRYARLPWRWASRLYAHSSFPSEQRNALADELLQGHYDVVIGVHAPLAVRLASVADALRRQNPQVVLIGWIHNSFEALFSPGSLYIGPQLRTHYLYQLRRLDQTVVLCQHDRRQYETARPPLSPVVIYNPLTLKPGPVSQGNSRRFLAVGRFTPLHKGFDLLIEAFARFVENDNEWTLHIVGEGPEEERYRQMIAEAGLQHRVFLHPFTNDIQQHYSAAQVYVLSSRWEGFGLVLIEAMAHGLPIVTSDLPTSMELLGDEALFFHNGSVEDLTRQLAAATQLDWPRRSAAAQALARRFDVTAIAGQWRELMSALTRNAHRRQASPRRRGT